MSLSTWFRDYLYIPLGGNRVSPIRNYFNLMLVFLLCGIWHGAAWTFIIWGAYHGLFLMLEKLYLSELLNRIWRPFRHLYTIIVFMFGWVIFRAENMQHLSYLYKTLFGFGNGVTEIETISFYLNYSSISAIVLGVVFSMPLFPYLKLTIKNSHSSVKVLVGNVSIEVFYFSVLILSLINVASGSYNPFIYFRF
jgi:alginate O-acetyltransferase complex protein AlgI